MTAMQAATLTTQKTLEGLLRDTPYVSYSYSYPHKTAYRTLEPPMSLGQLWEGEKREALFLYMHVPFCEMRCGFCNLFTTANPREEVEKAYLDALERHARRVREALGDVGFARMAIGGGTPTYLSVRDLGRLFGLAEEMGVNLQRTPISVETSPGTAEPDKLRLLREHEVDRISIGVQSFIESEAHAVGRAQHTAEVHAALGRIREAGFPTLNIDMIYGLPGQTVESWRFSLQAALDYAPEELYLYPLYNRPLTGLGKMAKEWDDNRLECYRAGRALLLDVGYSQVSMRMFRAPHAPTQEGPVYCCQEDGMVGIGCGARSYTRALHYSSEYAVSARGVRGILAEYIRQPDEAFDVASYGYILDGEDQRRRYTIQSLLQAEGLELEEFERRFGSQLLNDLPELCQLTDLGLAGFKGGSLRLTEYGMERSDTIGPWLYSERARRLMEAYELR
jgi:oxygen-independent coproporphyrinogen-3 oxidase